MANRFEAAQHHDSVGLFDEVAAVMETQEQVHALLPHLTTNSLDAVFKIHCHLFQQGY
jgi:hypothetical protein